jgi:Ca-activated chloride channel family protein
MAAKGAVMTLLYPAFLWFLIPLAILWYYRPKTLTDSVHLIILALLLLVMARPALESKPLKGEIESRNIIIAVDVSYSMRAKDIAPDRYRYAKETINQLLASNHTDNIMLIAFTTNPLLLSPPTTDHTLISLALESLDTDDILTHGTSLERLFEKIATLPMQEKIVLLLTDGGDSENLPALQEILHNNGISLVVLALGTASGATIIKKDGGLLKDSGGNLVVSRINPQLKTLTQQTGGRYISAPSTPLAAAEALLSEIDSLTIERHTISKMQQHYTELYQIPLFIAIMLFLILHTRAVKLLLPLAALWGSHLNASLFDNYKLHQAYVYYQSGEYNTTLAILEKIDIPSLQSQMTKADSYYRQGQYAKAAAIYRSIRTRSPKIKQILYYNLGNCYAQTKAYEKAAPYYVKALQLGEDKDAEYNLKLVMFRKNETGNKLQSARPKSQNNDDAGKKEGEVEEGKQKQQNSGGGSGGGGGNKSSKKEKNKKLKLDSPQENNKQKLPLSSKVYDLINKGYVHEKSPW